jgi:energy-coupling factor transporter ATP-binding protein EcfA2
LLGNDKNELSEQVNRVITQLELENQRDTRIDKLSGGQRKRASVSLELLTEPAFLILDEPTSGLGPDLDRQVMITLRQLADGNRTVLVITHSVAQLKMCDQVLVLAPGGMPAYYGPPGNIQSFFGTDNWADIFASLAENPERAFETFKSTHPALPARKNDSDSKTGGPTPTRSPKWWSQFSTLCRRQAKLIFADRGYLGFLLALPIVIGLLVSVVPGSQGLGPASSNDPGEPSQLLAMLIIGASFMGASISIRDLVGERPIFLRERAVGLPISAYLASKMVVFGIFAWGMAALLTLVTFMMRPGPTESVFFTNQMFELFLALGLTSMASMVLGLLLSSLVRSSEQAMPLLIIVLMAQLVLNGGLLPLYGRDGLYELSSLALAKWGFAMSASGVDLMNLSPSFSQDPLWEPFVGVWVLSAAVLISMTALLAMFTRIRLESSYLK